MTLTVDGGGPASVAISRLVEWSDTDAAARYHHSTVIRWVEAAEAELLAALDLLDLFGFVPRVRYEVDYLSPLFFRDEIELVLTVESVGESSIRYAFDVRHLASAEDVDYGEAGDPATSGPGLAARGAMVAVLIEGDNGGPRRWPDAARARLMTAGPQRPHRQ